MSEPKIARRCPFCGASIREVASFCPQCGMELSQQKSRPEKPADSVVTTPLNNAAPAEDLPKADDPVVQSVTEPLKPKSKEEATLPTEPLRSPAGRAAVSEVRGKIRRATALARDVEGDVIHRVQKVREISSVVLDEAGYDPSLRFVLVAVALFVLFLIILLLNKLIS